MIRLNFFWRGISISLANLMIMQGSASANLTMKMGDTNTDTSTTLSLVPGVTFYQITDKGIDVQANWGGMVYMKDSELN